MLFEVGLFLGGVAALLGAAEIWMRYKASQVVRKDGTEVPFVATMWLGSRVSAVLIGIKVMFTGEFRQNLWKDLSKLVEHEQVVPQESGKGGWAQISFFGRTMVLATQPSAVKAMLFAPEDKLGKLQFGSVVDKFLSHSILLETGESWKRQKRVLSPAFKYENLQGMVPTMVKSAEELCAALREEVAFIELVRRERPAALMNKVVHEGVEVYEWLQYLTRDIIARVGFGTELSVVMAARRKAAEERTAVGKRIGLTGVGAGADIVVDTTAAEGATQYEELMEELLNPIHLLNPLDRLVGADKRVDLKLKAFETTMLNLMQSKAAKMKRDLDEGCNVLEGATDIMGLLLHSHICEESLTELEVLRNLNTFYIAGQETVSGALANTLFLLALNPDAQAQARAEVRRVCGEGDDFTLGNDQVREMEYCHACLKESLRLVPVAPLVARVALEDVELDGVNIPKGTALGAHFAALHHHPMLYPEPEHYRPERFLLGADSKPRPSGSWSPFSLGPRQCIGNQLALLQLRLELSLLLHNFDFQVCPSSEPYLPTSGVVFGPPAGAQLRITCLN
mmetsp:Transcript_13890/g.39518  ORF Transcript_13890/g.39518 Transcript_13890/m.39518 type:complete len:566 (+) Transcript_13890:180-1877(+)